MRDHRKLPNNRRDTWVKEKQWDRKWKTSAHSRFEWVPIGECAGGCGLKRRYEPWQRVCDFICAECKVIEAVKAHLLYMEFDDVYA